jgi:hypothetical protein
VGSTQTDTVVLPVVGSTQPDTVGVSVMKGKGEEGKGEEGEREEGEGEEGEREEGEGESLLGDIIDQSDQPDLDNIETTKVRRRLVVRLLVITAV